MRATYLYGAGDVRVIDVPDPTIQQPTDALVRVVRACVCGSDLHPFHDMPAYEQAVGVVHPGGVISRVGVPQYEQAPVGFGSLFGPTITLTGGHAPARAYIETLLPAILDGSVQPGRVFDRTVDLEDTPEGYRAMDERTTLKVTVRP